MNAPAMNAPAMNAPAMNAPALDDRPRAFDDNRLATATLVSAVAVPSPWVTGTSGSSGLKLPPPPVPPPSPAQHIAPPPLMLVPPPMAGGRGAGEMPDTEEPAARMHGPLDARYRLELIDHERADVDRVIQRWGALTRQEHEDPYARDLRDAFGGSEPTNNATARRQLLRIMTHARASTGAALRDAMRSAVDEDGVFDAPMLIVHGTLCLSFDEVATLEAIVSSVAPYLEDNELLRERVEHARELLSQKLLVDSPEVAEELSGRIRQVYAEDGTIDDGKVERRVERMLLQRRAFAKRIVLGTTRVRAFLSSDGARLPCYLPESAAKAAPLFSKFTARLIVEVHPRQDQYETNNLALRSIALGRITQQQDA